MALIGAVPITVRAQNPSPQSASAAQAAAAAAAKRRRDESSAAVNRALIAIDPSRLATIGIWPGKAVPCSLPKRSSPYECHALLEGPAIIFSFTGPQRLELIVAHGDQDLASGKRSWWLHLYDMPLSLIAIRDGETLYAVGTNFISDGDMVATIYRP